VSSRTDKLGPGYIHIYTGNGKGKTTAAMGLALRAAGCGLKTCIVQFMKGQHYSELESVKMLQGLVRIEQYGHPAFCRITDSPDPEDVARARAALERLRALMGTREYDIVVADEAVTAMKFGFISEEDLLGLMEKKPEAMELVLTGRGATPRLIEAADLVTEMVEVRHYYQKGVAARCGIES
jgi:cob(I)alamin adenosyltransferase